MYSPIIPEKPFLPEQDRPKFEEGMRYSFRVSRSRWPNGVRVDDVLEEEKKLQAERDDNYEIVSLVLPRRSGILRRPYGMWITHLGFNGVEGFLEEQAESGIYVIRGLYQAHVRMRVMPEQQPSTIPIHFGDPLHIPGKPLEEHLSITLFDDPQPFIESLSPLRRVLPVYYDTSKLHAKTD